MKNILITALLLIFCTEAIALNLTAEVDRTTLASNESLRLTVTVDEQAKETIDFSQLSIQFDIINNQTGSQTSIINGKVSSNTQWTLILSPKETGKLVIPSFEYRGAYSQAIAIAVDNNYSNNTPTQNRDVFLQVNVDKNSLHVQEQLLLTIRLHYRISLSGYDTEELQLDNTTINLVSENTFQANIKGTNYNVLEKVYALHPQSSGRLAIPAQSWRLEKSMQRFGFGRSDNPYLHVRSEPIDINVKPIPKNSTSETWLPANKITLDGKWQQSIVNATVGEPLNYQLTLTAKGLTAAQLPNISIPDTDEFTIYSDQPDINNTQSQAGIVGSRANNFAVIPRTKGTFTFPEITIKWWNIETNQEKVARIPQQTIVVSASDIQPDTTVASATNTAKELQTNTDNTTPQTPSILWQTLTLIFALTSLTLGFSLYKSHGKPAITSKNKTTDTANDESNKRLLKTIKINAREQDWPAMRQHIIEYGRQLSGKNIQSLNNLGNIYSNLNAELQALDNQLYGKITDTPYNPDKLLEKISSIKKIKAETEKKEKNLADLYKN